MKAQLRPDNPAKQTESPVDAKSRQRKRRLDDRELALVWKAADSLGYPFGSAVQLLILSGQRRNEVMAAPRTEFDLDARQWVIAPARAKNNVEHLVPLSAAACDLVANLPTVEGEGGFLFTTNGETPISGYSKWKAKLDAKVDRTQRRQAAGALDDARSKADVLLGLCAAADSERDRREGAQPFRRQSRRHCRRLQSA